MAVDKLVDSTQLNSDLTTVANAIRTKGGTSAQLAFPSDFVSAIAAIPSGGSSEFELLKTVDITEGVNSIKINYESSWEDYDIIFAVCDFVLSSADYIYLAFNTETPAPTHYTHNLVRQWFAVESVKIIDTWDSIYMTVNAPAHTTGFPTYLFIKCYNSATTFTTDSSIKIYGGKLS